MGASNIETYDIRIESEIGRQIYTIQKISSETLASLLILLLRVYLRWLRQVYNRRFGFEKEPLVKIPH